VKPHSLPIAAVAELCAIAASHSGYREDALPRASIEAAAHARLRKGQSLDEVLHAARSEDPELIAALLSSISVGETYFFRQPEHFALIATELAPRWKKEGRTPIRAWSAGCSTGEEAYALAACLKASLPGQSFEVLGTDVAEKSVIVAREGSYGDWSVRESGPPLYPVVFREHDRWQVLPELAQYVSFEVHNLLSPPPPGRFDLVLCRNVLVYFSEPAQHTVVQNFASALTEGGAMLLAALDVSGPPPGFQRIGLAEHNAFVKAAAGARSTKAIPRPRSSPSTATATPDPVAIHLRALQFVERKQHQAAERVLQELSRVSPEYLPGLLERALHAARVGEWSRAAKLMRELLGRTDTLKPDEMVAGPEPLPVSFFRASAEAFLTRREDLKP
jgi:chemotaxis protein methyltransferase CheR